MQQTTRELEQMPNIVMPCNQNMCKLNCLFGTIFKSSRAS